MSVAKKLMDLLKDEIKHPASKNDAVYLQLVSIYPLKSIESKTQYETALKLAQRLISYTNEQSSIDSGVEDYLKLLSDLIDSYERKQIKSSTIGGAEMLAYLMELQGLKQSDLSKELGGQSVVSKILKGERELNLRQVRALAKRFKVSPAVFI